MILRLLPFVLLLLAACKTQREIPAQNLQLSEKQEIVFLDSTQAAAAIVKDEVEHFFDHITKLDLSIQLKRAYPDSIPRDSVLSYYQQSLQESVLDFTDEEIRFVSKAFREVHRRCENIAPNIFPQKVKLIKGYGYHYGYSVYYTREDCIFIPRGELLKRDETAFINVLLHEIFHIYSRYHPEQRKALYEKVGFKSIGTVQQLKMNTALRERILLNPDGVNFAYAINLKTEQGPIQAIPILISAKPAYDPGQLDFFAYLSFQLFPIAPPLSRLIPVKAQNDGTSPLQLDDLPDFFTQITDNTDYIIHPEEIIADNFVLVANGEAAWSDLSESGQQLVQAVQAILKKGATN